MSSGLDCLSDDDGDANRGADLPPIRQGTEQDSFDILCDDVGGEGSEQHSKDGMNPWSIAKLVGSNRRGKLAGDQVGHGSFEQARLQSHERANDKISGEPSSGLSRNLASGEVSESLPGRHGKPECRKLHGTPLHHVISLVNQITSGGTIELCPKHGLQSSPASSPHDFVLDESGPVGRPPQQRRNKPKPMAQPQISFDRDRKRQRHHDQIESTIDERMSALASSQQYLRKSPSMRPLGMGRSDFSNANLFDTDAGRRKTMPQPSRARQPQLDGQVVEFAATTAVCRRDGRADDGILRPRTSVNPKAHPVGQQRLVAPQPRKTARRPNTEQLPLETIPHSFLTCTLLLTATADTCQLARLLIDASEFDTWFVDGELKYAFEGGKEPGDTATLIERLLSHIGQPTESASLY